MSEDELLFKKSPLEGLDREEERPEDAVISEKQYAFDTIERYSGSPAKDFQPYVLLTNFPQYVEHFAKEHQVEVQRGSMFSVAHDKKQEITILDFKVGSPAAALVVDLLSFLPVKASLLLGMCAGLRRRYKVGDWMVPLACIRDEGTSGYYFPAEVPALANFLMTRAITETLEEMDEAYHLGISFTSNIRLWEYNVPFVERLKKSKAQCFEMECATLFTAGYRRKVSLGALLVVSDLPLNRGGVKTKKSSKKIFEKFMDRHISHGIRILECAKEMGQYSVKGSYLRSAKTRKKGSPKERPHHPS